jgi:NADH-quinone oxidoreductase subunit K
MFLCVEMMLQGVSLSLVAWGRYHTNWSGQILVVLIITVAACEAGVALALVLMFCRDVGNLDVASWQHFREEGTERFVDRELPEDLDPAETDASRN